MLELKPRVPFGPVNDVRSQTPWPHPATDFTVEWLGKTFVPAQEARLRQVTEAMAEATQRIEKIRAEASGNKMVVGEKRADGSIYRTGEDVRLQEQIDRRASQQVVSRIVEVRNSLDKVVPPVIVVMHRAADSAATLRDRYFDKLSCLSRLTAGIDKMELAALKANYATFVRGMLAIELHRLAQNALDNGSPQSLVLLDVIRVENFGRKKEDRSFNNAQLLDLITVPEHDQAQPFLQRVTDLYNEAYTGWLDFIGQTTRATNLRLGQALGKIRRTDSLAIHKEQSDVA